MQTNTTSGKSTSSGLMPFFLVDGVLLSAEHRVSLWREVPSGPPHARTVTTEWLGPFFALLCSDLGFDPKCHDPSSNLFTNQL